MAKPKRKLPVKSPARPSPEPEFTPAPEPAEARSAVALGQDLWDSVSSEDVGKALANLPDGTYEGEVVDAGVRLLKDGVTPQMTVRIKILNPEHSGRSVFYNNGLGSSQAIYYAKSALTKMGLSIPSNVDDLPEVLKSSIGKRLRISLRTQGDYQNSNILGLVSENTLRTLTPTPTPQTQVKAPLRTPLTKKTPDLKGKVVTFDTDEGQLTGVVLSTMGTTAVVRALNEGHEEEEWEYDSADLLVMLTLVGKEVSFKVDDGLIRGVVTADGLDGTFTIETPNEGIWAEVGVEELVLLHDND